MNTFRVIACFLGALGVILGAFGAHGLKPLLSDYQIDIYNKAVLYHFIHVIVVLVAATNFPNNKWTKRGILALIIGITFFSGSLYFLATAHLTSISKSILGPITPVGGIFFIAGWLSFAFSFLQGKQKLS